MTEREQAGELVETLLRPAERPSMRDIRRYLMPLALLTLVLVLSILSPHFLTVRNIWNVLYQTSVLTIVSIGMTFVIIGGGFDLSLGSVIALSGSLGAVVMVDYGVLLGVMAGLLAGILIGFTNGVIVSKLHVSPFIATLGTLVIGRGLALAVTGGATVSSLPDAFGWLGIGTLLGIPVPVILTLLIFIASVIVLRATPLGLMIYAVGGNPEASRLSGINVARVLIATYTICGFLAAVGGLVLAARVLSGQPTAGVFFELYAIAAVVLGGASLSGGEGKLSRTILGVLMIGVLQNGLNLLNVHSYWQQVVIGLVFVGSASLDMLRGRKA